MRLDKFLADCGCGTRSELKKLIKSGAVSVDGETVRSAGFRFDENTAVVTLSGRRIEYQKYICLMLNKPSGVVSATEDNLHKTVIDLVPTEYSHRKLFPIGRLDIDTEGLLLITDDGSLSHTLTSPRSHIPKTYIAHLAEEIKEEDIKMFERGITLDDGHKTLPARLLSLGERAAEVVIFEGRFHQVKRMFAATGNRVEHLKRVKIGGLELDGNLAAGELRELTKAELTLLQTEK